MPPLPTASTPWSGSMTSPFPVISSMQSLSATIITASSRRRYFSVRHALASSTDARLSCPGYSSSLFSRRSYKVSASAVDPAKPPMTPLSPILRTLRTWCLITSWPAVTCPSPMRTLIEEESQVRVRPRFGGLGLRKTAFAAGCRLVLEGVRGAPLRSHGRHGGADHLTVSPPFCTQSIVVPQYLSAFPLA